MSTLTRTVSGFTLTVRDMIETWSTWFSNCWYTMKKMRATMPAVVEWRKANTIVGTAPSVAPDQRDEVGEAHEEPQHPGVGHAEQGQHHPRRHARDHADHEVAEHVAGHRPRASMATRRTRSRRCAGHQAEGVAVTVSASEQHQEHQHQDRDGRKDPGEHGAGQVEAGRAEVGEALLQAVFVALDVVLEVVALDEVAKRTLAVAGVLDVLRQVVGEARPLVGQRPDEGVEHPGHDAEEHDEHEAGGEAAPHLGAVLRGGRRPG